MGEVDTGKGRNPRDAALARRPAIRRLPKRPAALTEGHRHDRRLGRSRRQEGNPKDLPPAPQFAEGWNIGKPDAVFYLPQEFVVPRERRGRVQVLHASRPTSKRTCGFRRPRFDPATAAWCIT